MIVSEVSWQLMLRSIRTSGIVSYPYSTILAGQLASWAKGSVQSSPLVTEYWGSHADGNEWRIHLVREEITDARINALAIEAMAADDVEQLALCDRALAGDLEARAECEHVIREANAPEPNPVHPCGGVFGWTEGDQ